MSQEISRSGWWPMSSAGLDDRVDELDRADEVAALELAHDRVAVAAPSRRGPPSRSLDLVVARAPSTDPIVPRSSRRAMRIASLVPSATELLFALGLGDDVVAVTHECDHPAPVAELPRLTRSMVPAGLEPAEIDAVVRERVGAGQSLYALDSGRLEELGVDLIVTQQVCEVCAVSSDDVRAIAARLPTRPGVISLDPSTLGEVIADAPRLGDGGGRPRRRRAAPRVARAPDRRRARRDRRSRAAPGRRARVARPRLLRRPLGPGDDRGGGRRRRPRHRARRQVASRRVGRGRRRRSPTW